MCTILLSYLRIGIPIKLFNTYLYSDIFNRIDLVMVLVSDQMYD